MGKENFPSFSKLGAAGDSGQVLDEFGPVEDGSDRFGRARPTSNRCVHF